MHYPHQIAQHFRDVHFGGNWASVNLKDTLVDVNWQQASTEVHSLNTIAKLVFHIHYYVAAVLKVLQGEPLDAHDKFSFDLPPIQSQEDWEMFLQKCWTDAEEFAKLIEQLSEPQLGADFSDPKYGSYYRNLHGIIEHTHYHLGQIVVVKKMLLQLNKV